MVAHLAVGTGAAFGADRLAVTVVERRRATSRFAGVHARLVYLAWMDVI